MERYQDGRTNLGELKGHIVKKIGVERSKRYFYYLSRFLSQKLTKSEFDKTCFKLLGRENLSLHNQLIRSILRNATVPKSPPPPVQLTKPVANNQNDPVCLNGVRKRKMRDSPVPVGSNGHLLQQPVCREDRRGDHHRYGAADERDGEFLRPFAKPRMPCKEQLATVAVGDGDDENQEEQARVNLSASPLVAPLGIQFCSASVGGGSRRTVPVSTNADVMSCYNSGGLPDTELLRKRMENIAAAQGLEGVSMECANTLNAMLDVHLKKLIKSCIHLVRARSANGREQGLVKQQGQNKRTQDEHSVSLLDFRTAMELNPQQLGEDWPTILERISIRSFEEQDLEVKL
ncbi:hypothetical protein Bca4012_010076 [Brassica carinata]